MEIIVENNTQSQTQARLLSHTKQSIKNTLRMKKLLSFSSRIENIRYVENLVDEISEKYSISSLLYGNILVSLVEAVSNAILHGNKSDSQKKVNVECIVNGKFIWFKIRDEGKGFNYQSIPDPTISKNIDKPHGRGVFLMRQLSDELKFNEFGNQVEFKFKLQ